MICIHTEIFMLIITYSWLGSFWQLIARLKNGIKWFRSTAEMCLSVACMCLCAIFVMVGCCCCWVLCVCVVVVVAGCFWGYGPSHYDSKVNTISSGMGIFSYLSEISFFQNLKACNILVSWNMSQHCLLFFICLDWSRCTFCQECLCKYLLCVFCVFYTILTVSLTHN